MLTKKEIEELIILSIKEIISDDKEITLNSFFIGYQSIIESIEIVQIISLVEDKLEEKGFEGYDLFEKTFENESLKFNEFANLIEEQLNQ